MAEQRALEAERARAIAEEDAYPHPGDNPHASVHTRYTDRSLAFRTGWAAALAYVAKADAARRAPPALDAEGLPHVKTWQERIGAKPGAPDGVVRFAMLEEIAGLRAQLARTSAPEGAPVGMVDAIEALLREAENENCYGGSEDSDGALHPGYVDWDALRVKVRAALAAPTSASAQPARQDQQAAEQSVIACARRVLSKFGADSDWSEWKDLADALREFDSAGQDQQSAQRASVDTLDFDRLLRTFVNALNGSEQEHVAARAALIAHINAWGSAGNGATSEAVSVMLWLYRRLPRTYGRPPHVEAPIIALAKAAGIDMKDVTESFAERGAAPSPAPQGEQAALNTQANV